MKNILLQVSDDVYYDWQKILAELRLKKEEAFAKLVADQKEKLEGKV